MTTMASWYFLALSAQQRLKLGTGKDNNRLRCSWARLDRPYAYPRSTPLIVGPNIDAQRPEARTIALKARTMPSPFTGPGQAFVRPGLRR